MLMSVRCSLCGCFFVKQKAAYEMRISDWSSDVCSSDLPALGPKDVRIKVHAAGLNFPDTLMIAGKYQVKPAFPFAPGMECAGVIDAVGDTEIGRASCRERVCQYV